MFDPDLFQTRIDHFVERGYLSYESDSKEHALLPTVLLLVLKIYCLIEGLNFPRVIMQVITKAKHYTPVLYVTPLGEREFLRRITSLSDEFFWTIAPVYKPDIKVSDFLTGNPSVLKNVKGLAGATTRKTIKPPITIHVIVDNSAPFDYLKKEYIFDSIYPARLFVHKLVRFLPLDRLEMYRLRIDPRTGAARRDKVKLLVTRSVYMMRQVDNGKLPKYHKNNQEEIG